MHRRPLVGCAACLLLAFVLIMSGQSSKSHGQNDLLTPTEKKSEIQALPLLKGDIACDRVAYVQLTNATEKPFQYLEYDVLKPNYLPVGLMSLTLLREGKVIPPRETPEGPELDRKLVRVLQPGESIVSELDLAETYGELPPGRYLLHVKYNIRPDAHVVNDLGLTPVEINKDLIWIDIE